MRVCLIGGCGHFERALEGIAASADCTLAAWAAPDEMDDSMRVDAALSRLGIQARYYNDVITMLDRVQPDACIVDNAFYQHAWAVQLCMQRGIHTLCEKPLALTLEGLEGLAQAQSKSGAQLWAMLTARFDPWFYTAKQLVDAGAIGAVRMINAQKSYRLGKRSFMYTKRQTYGGTIPWVGIHPLDLILYLGGLPVRSVYALHSSMYNHGLGELEMTALITLQLQNQVLATANLDYLRPQNAPTHDDDRVRIAGTQGVVEVSARQVTLMDQTGVSVVPLMQPPTLWEGFAAACKGDAGGMLDTTASLDATRLALWARQSADEGRLLHLNDIMIQNGGAV